MMKLVTVAALMLAGLSILPSSAWASSAKEITTLTNPKLEALLPAIEALAKNPQLGNCAPKVVRVKVSDLGDEIIENAINGFVSDLEVAKDLKYDFGVLVTTEATAEAIQNSMGVFAADGSDADLKTSVAALTAQITPLVLDQTAELKGGPAVYRKVENQIATLEENLTLRLLVDKTNLEFVLFGTGVCSTPSGQ